ncbi:15150_t:CDS:1, partial [Dentiscutata erythropus]
MTCTMCGKDRSEDQFIWGGGHHKTCKVCKEDRDQRKKSKLPTMVPSSTTEL